ncbi:MAG: DUF1549 domain-containing protein [Planctomycetes bacterium]|nr:DUF1549 domain-containing protein [Planctomycetota bacterium]MCB9885699.1 DUF1549 domain-containing protein [Planctomycetota bacterium]
MKAALVVFGLCVGGLSWQPAPSKAFDFRYDVLPFLQRHGCASAYCHGGGTGQGGMRLSLFGGAPLDDYGQIAVAFGGRRIDLREPGQSLLLQKGLGRLDHGGGRRLPRDGAAARALSAWIEDGAPWQRDGGRDLRGLQLRRDGARLVAEADFDGVPEDVSDRALFSSSDPLVVDVDEEGMLATKGPGMAYAIARFGSATARLAVVNRFGAPAAASAEGEVVHALDAAWRRDLEALGLQPVAAAAPQRLVRRLYLDLIGRPPTPAELDRFVAQPDVEATVRELTRRPAFAAVWGAHLAEWLEVPAANVALRHRLTAALAAGETLRAIAARVAGGDLPTAAAAGDPRDRAELVARTLLGLRIGCARCHDHPGDRWQRREYEAFSAAFVAGKAGGDGAMVGQVFDADTGQPVPPRWLSLDGGSVAAQPANRATLAAFVLDRGHGRLARHFANRVFAELFGRGLVEPLDDHRLGNPARSEALLAALAAEFERSGGDLPALLLFVATSRLYALDLAPDGDPRGAWFAARRSRALSNAAYARAVGAVVGRDPAGDLGTEPLARELALRNGDFLRGVLDRGGTTIDALFEFGAAPRERLDELWRTVLSRAPRPDEVAEFLPLASADLAAFRDLAMALLSGREFRHER